LDSPPSVGIIRDSRMEAAEAGSMASRIVGSVGMDGDKRLLGEGGITPFQVITELSTLPNEPSKK